MKLAMRVKILLTYCDFSIARPSVRADTEPDRLPCWTSVSDNFNLISARVGTTTRQDTKSGIVKCPTFIRRNSKNVETVPTLFHGNTFLFGPFRNQRSI